MVDLHHCKTCNDYYKCDKRCHKIYLRTPNGRSAMEKYRASMVKCPACKAEGR